MDSFYSKAHAYAGVLPYNEDLLPRHSDWEKWFDNKSTIIDEPGIDIDEWMNIPCDDDIHSSDEEAVVVDYDSGKEAAEFAARNQALLPDQKYQNKPNTNGCDTVAERSNLLKHYFDDIVNVSIWPQGIDKLAQPPISKQDFNTAKDMDWFGNLNKFKGIVKIAETRTICYSRNCDSDSDSDDTAEYIRRARSKGNKSSTGKTKSRLIKEYSNVATIKLKRTMEVDRIKRKIESNFPLDESESGSEKEEMGRNRLQSQSNLITTRLHSNSGSSSDSRHRYHIDYRSSRSSDSDPDDRILDNVRKVHKSITQDIVEPAIVAHSTTNKSADPTIEFLLETDQQLTIYDTNKCSNVPTIELSSDSDEDVKSEQDILCMSNSERLRLYGKCNMECGSRQASILYNLTKTAGDSSTDDDLFKRIQR